MEIEGQIWAKRGGEVETVLPQESGTGHDKEEEKVMSYRLVRSLASKTENDPQRASGRS